MNPTTYSTIQKDELIPVLQGIGFSRNEALVYLAVVELGPNSIWEISKKSGLKRPTCYTLLDELMVKGYATSSYDGRRTIYDVTSPRRMLQAAETRYNRFSATIAEFDALASKSPKKPAVRLFEGEEGIKSVYELSLELPKGSEVLVYSSDSLLAANYGGLLDNYIEKRVKRGINIRLLYADTSENRRIGQSDPRKLRISRFLPAKEYDPTVEVQIMGESIAYIAHSAKEPFATLIESAAIAKEERDRFNLLWKTGAE